MAYATEVKSKVLGISDAFIAEHSVVSKEVASAMALSVQKMMQTDYAIATTGNAGPTKGDGESGVLWVCIAGAYDTTYYQFRGNIKVEYTG